MEDWVDVYVDYPQLARGFSNVSKNVLVMLSDGSVTEAFYGFNQDIWYYAESGNPIPKYKKEVIAWKDK